MDAPPAEVVEFLRACGVSQPTPERLACMTALRELLAEANRTTNLTRVVEPEEFWTKHVADSVSLARFLPQLAADRLSLADVGCGAGFPLLPLVWAFPRIEGVGIDGKHRKIDFVNACCRRLGFARCSGVAMQVREAACDVALSGRFDLVVSRAMGDCARLLKETRGLLKPGGGRLVLYKTPQRLAAEERLAAREADKYGFAFTTTDSVDLPANAGRRQFAIFTRLDKPLRIA